MEKVHESAMDYKLVLKSNDTTYEACRHNVSVFKICVGFSVDQSPAKQKRAIGRGNQFGFVKAVDDDWIDANIWDQGRESGLDYKCSIHMPPHYITHLLNSNKNATNNNQQQQKKHHKYAAKCVIVYCFSNFFALIWQTVFWFAQKIEIPYICHISPNQT